MPTEKISLKDGNLYINGNIMNDKFIQGTIKGDAIELTLSSDEYYVLGDNVEMNALDSRYIGPVKKNQIKGKVIANFGSVFGTK